MSQAQPPSPPLGEPAALPCPSHPDRYTRLTCTRCGRPICSECMVAAPVGFQCRDCVGQAAAATAPRHPAPVARSGDRPYVTYTLIAICVVAMVLAFLGPGVEAVAKNFGMYPLSIAVDGEYYRLFTSVFLHWTLLHIGFNMLVLFMLGPSLEGLFGHFRYTVLYVLAGLGGAVASYCFSSVGTLSVGASGAIFGLMGAIVVGGRKIKADVTQVMILLVINLAIGFAPGGTVDWRAHLGGLVVGCLVAAIFAYAPKKNSALVQIVGCVLVVAVLGAMTLWRTEQLTSRYRVVVTPVASESNPSGTLDSPHINARSY